MPRFIMIRRDEATGFWENVGGITGEVEEHENKLPEEAAVEQMKRGGVYIAVPIDAWLLWDAEATVTVKPVMRREEMEQIEREEASLPNHDPVLDPLEDEDMVGMQQGPRQS